MTSGFQNDHFYRLGNYDKYVGPPKSQQRGIDWVEVVERQREQSWSLRQGWRRGKEGNFLEGQWGAVSGAEPRGPLS